MEQSKVLGQRRTVDINKGVFIVRYATAQDEAYPPRVRVTAATGSERHVSLILHPDAHEAVMWQPGSGIVVRASNPGTLVVEVISTRAGGSTAATVKLEPLSQGQARDSELASRSHELAGPSDFKVAGLRILGHVAGRGDVVVSADEWLGGPTSPARIEGLAIEWPLKPHGLDLRYGAKIGRPGGASTGMMPPGTFVGTRGRAMPIVGVVLELSGQTLTRFQLVAEALFLGAPLVRAVGERVVLSGPTGREPLVGLRVGVETVEAIPQADVFRPRQSRVAEGSRVRVFRGGVKQNRRRTEK